ncbi:Alcohol dehydrogenase superfamily zinc-containing [Neofusicoccum parvum]|uniref:Alcohol dehydrogenase superfamily zinc-containing n=2 Tax=Neofusicoccum parvum TaxID=310453 RepID=A0ACB5SPP6_9PEZI|nr:putative zinc-binding oxidoreductase protein [Neofusicoccum parvum UCRNP2]GME49558.1 Alcohol dehydrogenase superfamily zinc-containing [Neofusicoccum parvum]GME64214.1 Alcohol dehydrogenase superfamily zinc-containing [Neofusicoccum parvum]
MTKNQAAWITEAKGKPLKVGEAPTPKPGPGEVVIKNAAVAINPVDWKIQEYGLFLTQFPNILGTDVAGTIEEVGEGVTSLKKGQRVIGHTAGIATGDIEHSAFQLYSKTFEILAAPIPDSISFEEGAVLPLAISTAAAGLYQKTHLGLPFPSTNPQPTNQTLLIWGGSSSVGATAVQLAVASGLKVVATASTRNHDFVKSLGATKVVDYSSSSVVDDILAAIKEVGGSFAGVYDAISEPGSLKHIGAVTDKLGVTPVAVVLPPPESLTKTVESKQVAAPSIALQHKEVAHAVWGKFVPEGLASGQFKAKPDPLVVGKGLEKIQDALDKQHAGVSAQKVVVSL